MEPTLAVTAVLAAAIALGPKTLRRLQLSRAKHPSLRGHSKWSRRLARLVPDYSLNADDFFNCDGAPEPVAAARHEALQRLASTWSGANRESIQFMDDLRDSLADVDFTSAYRVPFPFRQQLDLSLRLGSVVEESRGSELRDLDGNWRLDVSGSYGVNVFGYDFYKACMERAAQRVGELGPVLGPYHPIIRDNVSALRDISGLDSVSFHMSGTEAVMQAVRLARYHTGRTHLVRLCGAYHGWWDGVQPGVGNQRKTNDVYTLQDMSERTLGVLRSHDNIACVLVNPLQALNPNGDAPGDSTLLASGRKAAFDRRAYTEWLQRLQATCNEQGIVLIMDEVFTGFRLGHRGAQEYFGVQADLVTYGKTLGGGFPVGVLCGRADLMRRYKPDQPANISFARGTFNSHPYVMAAMHEFLVAAEQPHYQQQYAEIGALWDARTADLNGRFQDLGLPVRIVNMHTVLTVIYTRPSRYNWMFQFYLRAQGLELSWVGTGRMIMSFAFDEGDFETLASAMVAAAQQMDADGWWWQSPELTDRSIRKRLIRELLNARLGLGQSPTPRKPDAADPALESVS